MHGKRQAVAVDLAGTRQEQRCRHAPRGLCSNTPRAHQSAAPLVQVRRPAPSPALEAPPTPWNARTRIPCGPASKARETKAGPRCSCTCSPDAKRTREKTARTHARTLARSHARSYRSHPALAVGLSYANHIHTPTHTHTTHHTPHPIHPPIHPPTPRPAPQPAKQSSMLGGMGGWEASGLGSGARRHHMHVSTPRIALRPQKWGRSETLIWHRVLALYCAVLCLQQLCACCV